MTECEICIVGVYKQKCINTLLMLIKLSFKMWINIRTIEHVKNDAYAMMKIVKRHMNLDENKLKMKGHKYIRHNDHSESTCVKKR